MIIEALINIIIKVITTAISVIHIPQIDDDIINNVNNSIDTIITHGSQLLDVFLPYNMAKTLLSIVIAVELGIGIYRFVMWVLKKIPMLNIS